MSTGTGSSQITSTFTALPLGYDCRDLYSSTVYGAPATHWCSKSILQKGHPATGVGVLGLGWGATRPVMVPQSAFGVNGVTGYLPVGYVPYDDLQPHLCDLRKRRGHLLRRWRPGCGQGNSTSRVGQWPGTWGASAGWVIREGENGFGGTMSASRKARCDSRPGGTSGPSVQTLWVGTSSWNMIPALGRSKHDPQNPYTNTGTFKSLANYRWNNFTLTKIGTGTPWTTGIGDGLHQDPLYYSFVPQHDHPSRGIRQSQRSRGSGPSSS